MKKDEFLSELKSRLNGLPKEDIDERVSFFEEAIDDRMADGLSEEEAINDLGGIDEVVKQIASETKMSSLVKERIKPKKVSPLIIVLLVLGFPLWFPLLVTAFALVLVALVLIFVLVIVTYSIEIALLSGGCVSVAASFAALGDGNFNIGYIGISLLSFGLALMFLFVCYFSTLATFKLYKNIILGIKRSLIGGKKNA